jgi:hypothetical protein
MTIDRREFLGRAALAAVLPYFQMPTVRGRTDPQITILDLGTACALRESVQGYVAAAGTSVLRTPVLIIPAALSTPMQYVENYLLNGGTVILESGAAFGESSSFQAHRETLSKGLGIVVEKTVELWPRSAPYIDLTWPIPVKVRDFSRVVVLGRDEPGVIATVDGLPVAARRSIGAGTLVFLGTPLGPALWTGDSEAKRWLSTVMAISPSRSTLPRDATRHR